jgi:hypothetical protein
MFRIRLVLDPFRRREHLSGGEDQRSWSRRMSRAF